MLANPIFEVTFNMVLRTCNPIQKKKKREKGEMGMRPTSLINVSHTGQTERAGVGTVKEY